MGKKVGVASQDYQKYRVHLVFVVTWAIRVLEVKRGPPFLGPQASLVLVEQVVRKESWEKLPMANQVLQEREVFQECQGPKVTEVIQDIQALKGQLAGRDSQVLKAPEAEREVLGFQESQVYLLVPAKEVPQGYQGSRDSEGLQAIQVPQVGKDSEGTWGLLVQLE